MPYGLQPCAVHFQDLHVDDNFRARLVVGADHLLDDVDHRCGRANRKRVGRLVREHRRHDRHVRDAHDGVDDLHDFLRVGVRQIEGLHDQVVVLLVRLRVVLRHDDRGRVEHLVEVPVRRQDLLQRLFDGDVLQRDRDRHVAEVLLIELDVDAALRADEGEHVAQAGVGELHLRQRGRGVQRGRGLQPRLRAQLLDFRLRPRFLDAIANRSLQLDRLRCRQAVRRVHLDRLAVRQQRRVDVAFQFEVACTRDVLARSILHRTFELDLVLRLVGALLQRARVVRDGGVPITRPRRFLAAAERTAGSAPGREDREHDQNHKPLFKHLGSCESGQRGGQPSRRRV